METFTFSTTSERLEKIKKHNHFNSISDFINVSLDFYVEHIETRFITDWFYYILLPFLGFLAFVGMSILFLNLFFYICTIIIGGYICILGFLFARKYKKVKK